MLRKSHNLEKVVNVTSMGVGVAIEEEWHMGSFLFLFCCCIVSLIYICCCIVSLIYICCFGLFLVLGGGGFCCFFTCLCDFEIETIATCFLIFWSS